MRILQLYCIGLMMGVADLIPGISGGTVAFMCGIYADFLAAIRSLQLHRPSQIAWSFLLPVGGGMATSLLVFSHLFLYLFSYYPSYLMALFFGVIAASSISCLREVKPFRFSSLLLFLLGASLSYILVSFSLSWEIQLHFIPLVGAGFAAASAMLFPGISGCYILQVLGVYHSVLAALSTPWALSSLYLLGAVGLGIAAGWAIFARVVGFLLARFQRAMGALFTGFVVGGLKALWPFGEGNTVPLLAIIIGSFLFIILLDLNIKRIKKRAGLPN